ncbi:flavodoxin family protein [Streptomyces lunaelactis]|uniref:flavodoxin family protein n=1 Tax=Streptomyces lunaelactis TaxID=1535768 RepID=UPI00158583B3|nr:flavodoxin family protein [Streptomyces lunaelactis]NUJ99761.1 flavodoxin family protein [Streptomyces lunaelactis]NUK08447.1 flavodoxin family protein [Streptomyces lunaelactis]NUK14563.1 flavodoxin family protein [Streptomyces lunaelactis]NUK21720.1 flavodoxin family protein [Streptomyces lunaelactis]NUK34410.1 flavodoxin family protein [Streptomyces lunaelactis]
MTTPVVSIAYHSGYGHTAVIAEAVREGAAATGATVHLIKVDEIDDAQWELLDGSDAIVFGSPTYMGTASGAFHQFAEDTSKRWFTDTWRNKLAAGFSNSGSKSGDKLHTLQFFATLAAQHGMHWVNLGLKPGWNTSEGSEHDLNRLGFFSGAAAQTNADEGPEGVHKADIATAEHLGRRVAETARTFIAGRAAVAA